MGLAANWLAAAILAASILFYVLVYTIWLKRRTPQNIVIGGAAGAFPPVIGWAAATGDVTLLPRPAVHPHLPVDPAAFLGAVAVRPLRLCRRGRADASGGRRRRGRPASRSCSTPLPMAAAAVAPWPLGLAGAFYGLVAAALSLVFVALALRVLANRATEPEGDEAGEAALRLSRSSICSRCSERSCSTGGCWHDRPPRRGDTPPPEGRAIIMALLLGAFVVLVYAITIAKMGLLQ